MVIDANVIVYCFVQRNISGRALAFIEGAEPLISPDLALVEIANTLAKYVRRKEIEEALAVEAYDSVPRLIGEVADTRHLVPEALRLGLKHKHSPADFIYVLLARERATRLATADTKLIAKLAQTPFIHDVLDITR